MKKRPIVYLDNAATTPIDPKLLPYIRKNEGVFANASSLHVLGRYSKQLLEQARAQVAEMIQAKANEVIFTSSGTEADNLALLGLVQANRHLGDEVIISAIEHKAVMEAAKILASTGVMVKTLPVDKHGVVDLKMLATLVTSKTILVSVVYANNEVGVVQPLKKISQIIKKINPQTIFHTDACQASNYLDLNVKRLGVDALTLSSSKIYAPKGVGCLYVNERYKIAAQIVGGDQEFGRRAGTENVAAIMTFAHALKLAQKIKERETKRLMFLRDYFIKQVLKTITKTTVNGSTKLRLPNNINLSFAEAEGESLLLLLDEAGICCSTGSACSALDLNPSHVLLAMGVPLELAHCSLRFSLGRFTTKKEINYTVKVLQKVVKQVRQISSLR